MEDSFVTMFAVILVIADNYIDLGSISINSIYWP